MKTYSDYAIIATDATHRIIAIGKEAYKYMDEVEKSAKGEITVYFTFKRNVVAEFEETVAVMKSMFQFVLTGMKNKILKPTVVVCIPFELISIILFNTILHREVI
ncbi:MAG: rod shape-determining protein [Velocimicrobium sp.]